jgi:hypothetical protein
MGASFTRAGTWQFVWGRIIGRIQFTAFPCRSPSGARRRRMKRERICSALSLLWLVIGTRRTAGQRPRSWLCANCEIINTWRCAGLAFAPNSMFCAPRLTTTGYESPKGTPVPTMHRSRAQQFSGFRCLSFRIVGMFKLGRLIRRRVT